MKPLQKLISLLFFSIALIFVLAPSASAAFIPPEYIKTYPKLTVKVVVEVQSDDGVAVPAKIEGLSYSVKRSAEMINPYAFFQGYTKNDTGLIPYEICKDQYGNSVELQNKSYSWKQSGASVSNTFQKITSFGYGEYYGDIRQRGDYYGYNADLLWFSPNSKTNPQLSIVDIEVDQQNTSGCTATIFKYDGRNGTTVPQESGGVPTCIQISNHNSDTPSVTLTLKLKYNPTIADKEPPEPPETEQSKTLQPLGDNEYRISLAIDSPKPEKEADLQSIIFVVDTSGYMVDRMGNKPNDVSRMKQLQKSLEQLVTKLSTNKHYRVSLVTFSKTALIRATNINPYVVAQKESLIRTINALEPKGGTNYYDAIVKLQEAKNQTDGEEKIVFFVTDGEPTAAFPGALIASGSDKQSDVAGMFALHAAKKMEAVDRFYAIYIGTGAGGSTLQSVTQQVQLTGRNEDSEKFMVQATSQKQFDAALNRFMAFIDKSWANLEIEDELSEYLDFADNLDATVTAVTRDINGNVIEERTLTRGDNEESGDYTLVVRNNKIKMHLNASTVEGTTYTLSFNVKANDTAMEYFYTHMDADGDGVGDSLEDIYPHVGDPDTGEFSGQPGFWSNKKATVTYEASGEQVDPKEFSRPVFQVEPKLENADIQFKKVLEGTELREGQFSFQLYDKNKEPVGDPVTNQADGTIVFTDLKVVLPGKYVFYAREIIPENIPKGYTYDESEKQVELTVAYNKTSKKLEGNVEFLTDPTFTNKYEPDPVVVNLTAKKKLQNWPQESGLEPGMFQFYVIVDPKLELIGPTDPDNPHKIEAKNGLDSNGNALEQVSDIKFDTGIKITEKGRYTFDIREYGYEQTDYSAEERERWAELLENVTYDPLPVTVVVVVDNDEEEAKLVVSSITYLNDEDTFINKYSKPLKGSLKIPTVLTGMRLKDNLFFYDLCTYNTATGEEGASAVRVGNSRNGYVEFRFTATYKEDEGRPKISITFNGNGDSEANKKLKLTFDGTDVTTSFLAKQVKPDLPIPYMVYDEKKEIVVKDLHIWLADGELKSNVTEDSEKAPELEVKGDATAKARFFNIYNVRGSSK